MAIRSLDEQFGAVIAERIRGLVRRLGEIEYPQGAARYFAMEARTALEAGALLAALCVTASLLEIAIRDLVISHSRQAARRDLNLQAMLEAKKGLPFMDLIDALVDADLFDPRDASAAKSFYREVRIPIHHGLPARLVGSHSGDFAALLRQLRGGESVGVRDLEEIVEDNALRHLETVVGVLERNCR